MKKEYISKIRKLVKVNIGKILFLEKAPKTHEKAKNLLVSYIKKYFGFFKKVFFYAGISVAVLLVIELGIVIFEYSYANKIAFNTYIYEENIGLKDLKEAEAVINKKVEDFKAKTLLVSSDNTDFTFTPEELGITVDTAETLKNLVLINQNYSQISFIKDFINRKNIQTAYSFNKDKAEFALEQKIPNIKENKMRNAYYSLDEKGVIVVNPGKEGIDIDFNNLEMELSNIVSDLNTDKKIILQYENLSPIITASVLEAQKAELEGKLNEKISLKSFEGTWEFNPRDYINSLIFDEESDLKILPLNLTLPMNIQADKNIENNEFIEFSRYVSFKIMPEQLNKYIDEEVSPKINTEAESAKIFSDENGKVKFEGTASIGKKVSSVALMSMIELSLNNQVKDLNIPIVEIRPEIDVSKDLQEKGIVKLIAVGHSRFAGSPANRIHNISTGMGKINGVMVGPGETFSFAEKVGNVDGSTGFKPELVIKPEGTVPEFGGGLCQVSSTFYRAALWAGFEIVDRRPHSYAVSYYAQVGGWGLDATVYPPTVDFKFKNNTPSNILLQSYTDGVDAWVKVYGTDDGRKVEMDGPYVGNYRYPGGTITTVSAKLGHGQRKQVEKSHTGFDATWYRHIIDKDGDYEKETIFTRYKAIPAKVLVGPDAPPAETSSSTITETSAIPASVDTAAAPGVVILE